MDKNTKLKLKLCTTESERLKVLHHIANSLVGDLVVKDLMFNFKHQELDKLPNDDMAILEFLYDNSYYAQLVFIKEWPHIF